MQEITIGNTVYVVKGDYPDGKYVKIPKNIYGVRPKRKITIEEFIDLFSDAQIEDIADSANKKVKAFLLKLRIMRAIDTESEFIETALNGLETLGLIGVGDAARILADAKNMAQE